MRKFFTVFILVLLLTMAACSRKSSTSIATTVATTTTKVTTTTTTERPYGWMSMEAGRDLWLIPDEAEHVVVTITNPPAGASLDEMTIWVRYFDRPARERDPHDPAFMSGEEYWQKYGYPIARLDDTDIGDGMITREMKDGALVYTFIARGFIEDGRIPVYFNSFELDWRGTEDKPEVAVEYK